MPKFSRPVLRVLLPCALLAPFAHAEPFGFKGAALGSPFGLIANNPKYDCRAVTTPTADRVCGLRKDEQETMAGVPVESVFHFYDQGLLTGVVVHLEERHFQAVTNALAAKYGKPATTRENLKTLDGTAHENLTHTWRQGQHSIVVQRYSGRIDKTSVRIQDDSAAARIRQRRESLAAQPERDL